MSRYPLYMLFCATIIAVFAVVGNAQQTSTTDATTPTGQAKGTPPLGSYGGSDFDRVNLFSGNVSMTFALAPANRQAGLGTGMTLSYNSKFWRFVVDHPTPTGTSIVPLFDEWDGGAFIAPGWRINTGRLYARHSGWLPDKDDGCSAQGYTTTLTRVTLVAPDGTE